MPRACSVHLGQYTVNVRSMVPENPDKLSAGSEVLGQDHKMSALRDISVPLLQVINGIYDRIQDREGFFKLFSFFLPLC